ncbi:MAG: hypothetical protein ACI8QC_004406 [Planctomycetota bacterium]|jgi:hypothetical protein
MIEGIQPIPPLQPLFGRTPLHSGKELTSYLQDQVSLSKPDRATSMQLVEQLVDRHLADEFPVYEAPTEGAEEDSEEPRDATPEGVAQSIFERISGGLYESVRRANPDLSEAQFEKFSAEVFKGVERGLSEARDVLEGMEVLEGAIESDVEKTGELLNKHLKLWVESTTTELFGDKSSDAA